MEKSPQTKRKRTLYLVQITKEELSQHWEMALPIHWKNPLFIRCTKEGYFSWEENNIYHQEELIGRPNVVIVERPSKASNN